MLEKNSQTLTCKNSPISNEPTPPHLYPFPRKGEEENFAHWNFGHYLIMGAWSLVIISDRPDLLPHKDKIANPKAEKGNGHQRNQMGCNDEEALKKRKRTLETTQRKSLQRPHEDQRACGLSHWIENRCGNLIIEGHGGTERNRPRNLFMFDHHLGVHAGATLTDRSHGISQNTSPQTDEKREKYPYG